jgi:hypothetical protein
MKIAIIAWGSLIWNQGTLKVEGDWKIGGPELPLEFSRVSKDCRLTLVIDGKNGKMLPTRYAQSARKNIEDAISDLRDREGTTWSRISFINLTTNTNSSSRYKQPGSTFRDIELWAKKNDFNATIWTGLGSSFELEVGTPFSLHAATDYLEHLPEPAKKVAIQYLEKAPAEVVTPLREYLSQRGIIAGKERWGVT